MTVSIRAPADRAEYRAIAALHTMTQREDVTPEHLYMEESHGVSAATQRRMVAVDGNGRIVGTSLTQQHTWRDPGHCDLSIAVPPEARRQGIGSQLYADAVANAKAHGMTRLITTLRDDQLPESRTFAEQRGFALFQHWVYWELPLPSFQEARFQSVFAHLDAQHIRFLSLAEAGNTPEAQRKLYDLNRRTSLDAPGEDSFPTFETFMQDIVQADWFRSDSQILAADGEQWVGLVAVGIDGPRAFNAFTGVDRTHRRRGIALALTLLAICYAQQQHATVLEVMNDSRNEPMFALQTQLGYHRIPGRYIMDQHLG